MIPYSNEQSPYSTSFITANVAQRNPRIWIYDGYGHILIRLNIKIRFSYPRLQFLPDEPQSLSIFVSMNNTPKGKQSILTRVFCMSVAPKCKYIVVALLECQVDRDGRKLSCTRVLVGDLDFLAIQPDISIAGCRKTDVRPVHNTLLHR